MNSVPANSDTVYTNSDTASETTSVVGMKRPRDEDAPVPTIPLTLEKSLSMLDNCILLEYFPVARLKALLKSDKLALEWKDPSYAQKFAAQSHENEVAQMKAYLKAYTSGLGAVPCKYVKPKHGWGRVHPRKSMGLTSLGRLVRNTLIKNLYYDFDLKNAQVEIIWNICVQNGIDCPQTEDYCKNRGDRLEAIVIEYGVEKSTAKTLIIRLCFFGTFEGWAREHGVTKPPTEWIKCFIAELQAIAQELKSKNTALYESARKSKQMKKDTKNVIGSFFALYLQEWELRIVENVMNWLIANTDIMKHPKGGVKQPVGVYEYDGIKLLKENVDKFEGGKEGLRQRMIEKTEALTGFKVEWVEKPIDKFHDITAELEAVEEEESEVDKLSAFIERLEERFDDTGVIETIEEMKPKHFVYCKNGWYGWTGEKWLPNDRPLQKAIMYGLPAYWRSQLRPFTEKYPKPEGNYLSEPQELLYGHNGIVNRLEGFIKNHLRSNHRIHGCMGRAQILLADDTIEFDLNPDLLGFMNGVYDIKEECFRKARFDDHVSWSTGWAFRPVMKGMKFMKDGQMHTVDGEMSEKDKASMDKIQRVLEKIQPHKGCRFLVLLILASGLSGWPIEKFFIFNGAGRNGKGFLNEFMLWCLGEYAVQVSPAILTELKRFQSSSAPNPEKAKLHKKRFVITSEPAKHQKINNDTMKDLTGGGETQARMLHSSETRVLLYLTFLMECNEKPQLNETPTQADAERILDCLFPSLFTSKEEMCDEGKLIFPQDPSLKSKEWKDQHKNAFMNILIEHLLILKNAKYNIDAFVPETVKKRSLEYLQDSFDIHNIFTTLFEKRRESMAPRYRNYKNARSDKDWSLAAIVKHLRGSQEFANLPKQQQCSKELRSGAMKSFFKTNVFYKNDVKFDLGSKQNILKGWRLKVDELEAQVQP